MAAVRAVAAAAPSTTVHMSPTQPESGVVVVRVQAAAEPSPAVQMGLTTQQGGVMAEWGGGGG